MKIEWKDKEVNYCRIEAPPVIWLTLNKSQSQTQTQTMLSKCLVSLFPGDR